ncbi:MAG: hypothetical protein U0793_23455 [Gemmataceae bacterium]
MHRHLCLVLAVWRFLAAGAPSAEPKHDADGKLALKVSLKLDPSKSPEQMDATTVFNNLFPGDKSVIRCIYRIEGDELKIAYPAELFFGRPREFTTRKGSLFTVATYKRVKKYALPSHDDCR